jgi:hypothetical protein
MAESINGATSGTPTSSSPKRGFWRRFFLWGFLGGGILFGIFLVFLVSITLPDLRREVAAPEISGAGRVAVSQDSSKTALALTSGTFGSLNLDDFPHLSPKMRELAQAWLDQCEETSRALDSITDPALRAQALGFLKGREEMRAFLNLPLEWDPEKFRSVFPKIKVGCRFPTPYGKSFWGIADHLLTGARPEGITNEQIEFFKKCPEFARAFREELHRSWVLNVRMGLEYRLHDRQWNDAARICIDTDTWSFIFRGPSEAICGAYSWDEKVYCLRQVGGVQGLAIQTACSYRHAIELQIQNRTDTNLYFYPELLALGNMATAFTTMNMDTVGEDE